GPREEAVQALAERELPIEPPVAVDDVPVRDVQADLPQLVALLWRQHDVVPAVSGLDLARQPLQAVARLCARRTQELAQGRVRSGRVGTGRGPRGAGPPGPAPRPLDRPSDLAGRQPEALRERVQPAVVERVTR